MNKEYEKAFICYKKMLMFAWLSGKTVYEVSAFQGLAI
jgi:hypothetical protein